MTLSQSFQHSQRLTKESHVLESMMRVEYVVGVLSGGLTVLSHERCFRFSLSFILSQPKLTHAYDKWASLYVVGVSPTCRSRS
jgi:hypothetical protein